MHIILYVLSADACSRWLGILIQGGSKKTSTEGVRRRGRPAGGSDRWVRSSKIKECKELSVDTKVTAHTNETYRLCCIIWYRNANSSKTASVTYPLEMQAICTAKCWINSDVRWHTLHLVRVDKDIHTGNLDPCDCRTSDFGTYRFAWQRCSII